VALRWLIAGVVATMMFTACASAPQRWPSERTAAPDPYRFERTACRIEAYPAELDGSALARARYEDLRARQDGAPPSTAAARIERERAAFEARCAVWRAELARL
jgi:hypothetical protein